MSKARWEYLQGLRKVEFPTGCTRSLLLVQGGGKLSNNHPERNWNTLKNIIIWYSTIRCSTGVKKFNNMGLTYWLCSSQFCENIRFAGKKCILTLILVGNSEYWQMLISLYAGVRWMIEELLLFAWGLILIFFSHFLCRCWIGNTLN